MNAADTRTPGSPDGLPPEVHNDEQDPKGSQAQDVAEDARREDSRTSSPLESTKPQSHDYDPAPDSTGDLIDEMNRMEGEGRIDMSAFAGEPNHDDEPGIYGGETTDDDEVGGSGAWLIADGEDLTEEEEEDGLVGDNDDDEDLASIERLLGEVEIPEDDTPEEIVPLPDEDPLPGDVDGDDGDDADQ